MVDMKNIMAEIERVNALESEVNTTIERRAQEINKQRKDKLAGIEAFMTAMRTAMRQAGVPRVEVPCCGYAPDAEGNWSWPLGVAILRDRFDFGSFNVQMSFGPSCYYNDLCIDRWNEEAEQKVYNAVVDAIKKTLAKRLDNMTKELKASNDEYANYFGKEEN